MLQISETQFTAFTTPRRLELSRQLREHLAAKHPELLTGLAPAAIDRRLGVVVEAGEAAKLEAVRAFALFSALMFRFGPKFAETPAVVRALKRAETPDLGLARLPGTLDGAQWEAVARASVGRWPDEEH